LARGIISGILADNGSQLYEFGFVIFRHDFRLIQGHAWNLPKLAYPKKMSRTLSVVTIPPYLSFPMGNDINAGG